MGQTSERFWCRQRGSTERRAGLVVAPQQEPSTKRQLGRRLGSTTCRSPLKGLQRAAHKAVGLTDSQIKLALADLSLGFVCHRRSQRCRR
jgi:hypothetical protein